MGRNKMVNITLSLAEQVLSTSTWAMILTGGLTFASTFLIAAPYGKFSSAKGWGPLLPANLSWMLMEAPNLWVSGAMIYAFAEMRLFAEEEVAFNDLPVFALPNQILLGLFLAHYFHRAIVFPLSMPEGSPMPLAVMLLAFFYCLWNGFTQSLALVAVTRFPSDWLSSAQFIAGIAIFVTGFVTNIYSDRVLFGLKAKAKAKAQNVQYVIPEGGLFRFVSCANYLGEVVEWTGFAIACNSLPAAAFAWYTFSNLYPRAYAQHKWYLQKFENYPKNRTAMIPFVC